MRVQKSARDRYARRRQATCALELSELVREWCQAPRRLPATAHLRGWIFSLLEMRRRRAVLGRGTSGRYYGPRRMASLCGTPSTEASRCRPRVGSRAVEAHDVERRQRDSSRRNDSVSARAAEAIPTTQCLRRSPLEHRLRGHRARDRLARGRRGVGAGTRVLHRGCARSIRTRGAGRDSRVRDGGRERDRHRDELLPRPSSSDVGWRCERHARGAYRLAWSFLGILHDRS
jgi:hypothetical protein